MLRKLLERKRQQMNNQIIAVYEDFTVLRRDNVQLSKENIRIKEESNQKDEEIKKLRHQVEVNRFERRVRGKNINKQRTLKKIRVSCQF